MSGADSFSITNCSYTKIGNLVHLTGQVYNPTNVSASYSFEIGLPFTIHSNSQSCFPVMTSNVDLTSGYTQLVGYLYPNTTRALIYKIGDNVTWASLAGSDITTSGSVIFSMTYRVA